MIATILPGKAKGTAFVPESKSEKHRILIAKAIACYQAHEELSHEDAMVDSVESEDILATKESLQALFAQQPMNCRDSASTLRFLFPLALVLNGGGTFFGSERLFVRGIAGYEEAFSNQDIRIEKQKSLSVSGTFSSGRYEFRGDLSSQYLSGMLFALPLLPNGGELLVKPPIESRPYLEMTIAILKKCQIVCEQKELEDGGLLISVPGHQSYSAPSIEPERDFSSASIFLLINDVMGGEITVDELFPANESLQGDSCFSDLLLALEKENPTIDIKDCPDLAPNLFAAAALKNGATFTHIHRLRNKESDRISAMQEVLSSFGIETFSTEDTFTVKKCAKLKTPEETISGHHDHRIVMAAAALCTLTGGKISDAEAVAKSFPQFFDVLKTLEIPLTISESAEEM